MADSGTGINIPNQSIIYLLLCLSGIFIFVFAGIIPQYRYLVSLEQKISRFKGEIEEEKYLTPVYESLKNKTQFNESRLLTFPLKESLSKEQTDAIFKTFGETSRKSGMTVLSIVPNINSLTGNSKRLSVNIILHGEYFNFRKFLSRAGEIPYLEYIEDIEIKQTSEGKEYRMKVWLAVS